MISAVKKRELCLKRKTYQRPSCNIDTLFESVIYKKYNPTHVSYLLEYWEDLDEDQVKAFDKVLTVMDEAFLYDNPSNIKKYTHTIVENIIPKARSAVQFQATLKRRLGTIKSKLSKRIHSKLDTYKKPMSLNQSITKTQSKTPDQNGTKQQVAQECYQSISEAINNCICYDRIISNHAKLAKRYNIDNFVKESIFTKEQAADTVLEFCKLIDTYNLPIEAKMSIALENTLYAYEKNRVPYDRKSILENVIDYFLFYHNEDADMAKVIKDCLPRTVLYEAKDYEDLDIFPDTFIDNFSLFEQETADGFSYIHEDKIREALKEIKKGSSTTKNAIKEYKFSKEKTPESMKRLILSIYNRSAEDIIEDNPDILNMILMFFVLGTAFSISSVIGILAAVTMAIIHINMSLKNANKLVDQYERHLKKVEKKLDKEEYGSEKYKRLEAYKEKLESDLEKLKDYRDDLKSEYEKQQEEESEEDEDLEESVETLKAIDLSIKYIDEFGHIDINEIFSKANSLALDDFDLLAEYAVRYPDLLDPEKLNNVYSIQRESVLSLNAVSKYVRSSIISDAIYKLTEAYNESYDENISTEDTLKQLNEMMITIDAINESINSYDDAEYPLLELTVKNSINLAVERIKKAATDLSEKEKALSKTIDMSFENLGKGLTNAEEREDREAVIRGQVLPPASRIIKTAIISGATWLVHPALTAIYLIGKFALSSKNRAKERQIILDEIDVELNMCDRYIKEAEDKNDLKAIRRLLMIKKKLEAQRSRLVFKMKTEYKEDVPSRSAGNSDDDY